MAAWFGDSLDRKNLDSIQWVPTSFIERIKFFIARKPVYRFKTRFYDEEYYDVHSFKVLVEQMKSIGFAIEYQQVSKIGWSDMTRFLALDQSTMNSMTIMQ